VSELRDRHALRRTGRHRMTRGSLGSMLAPVKRRKQSIEYKKYDGY
jgi:hypothetical protein